MIRDVIARRTAPDDALARHPLDEAIGALSDVVDWRSYRFDPGVDADDPGLICVAALFDDTAKLTAWQHSVSEALEARHGQVAPILPAATVLDHAAILAGWLGAALFHLARRVPLATPERLFVTLGDDGDLDAVIVGDGTFACLRDDLAANHVDARPVADERALAAVLRAHAVRTARRFDANWRPAIRVGPRMRWGAFTDALDTAPWAVSMDGDESRGAATSAVILGDADQPLLRGSRIYCDRDHHGREFFTRDRHACCFEYTLPDTAACFSCPRTGRTERRARASAWPDDGPPD